MNQHAATNMRLRMNDVLAHVKTIQIPEAGDNLTIDRAMLINQVNSTKITPLVEAFMYAAALKLPEQDEIRELIHSIMDANLDLMQIAAVKYAETL